MAKTTKTATVSPFSVSAAVASATLPVIPNDIVNASPRINFGMDVDFKLNTDDIVGLAVGEAEERLVSARQAASAKFDQLLNEHKQTVASLSEQADTLVDKFQFDGDTKTLLEMLRKKTGNTYAAKIAHAMNDSWNYREKKPEVDEAKAIIKGRVKIALQNGGSSELLGWDIEIPFNTRMEQTAKRIRDLAQKANTAQLELGQLRDMLADLPRLRDRAKRQLTLAVAQGQVTNLAQAVNVVMDTQSKALPAPVGVARAFLPGPATVNVDVTVNNND